MREHPLPKVFSWWESQRYLVIPQHDHNLGLWGDPMRIQPYPTSWSWCQQECWEEGSSPRSLGRPDSSESWCGWSSSFGWKPIGENLMIDDGQQGGVAASIVDCLFKMFASMNYCSVEAPKKKFGSQANKSHGEGGEGSPGRDSPTRGKLFWGVEDWCEAFREEPLHLCDCFFPIPPNFGLPNKHTRQQATLHLFPLKCLFICFVPSVKPHIRGHVWNIRAGLDLDNITHSW